MRTTGRTRYQRARPPIRRRQQLKLHASHFKHPRQLPQQPRQLPQQPRQSTEIIQPPRHQRQQSHQESQAVPPYHHHQHPTRQVTASRLLFSSMHTGNSSISISGSTFNDNYSEHTTVSSRDRASLISHHSSWCQPVGNAWPRLRQHTTNWR